MANFPANTLVYITESGFCKFSHGHYGIQSYDCIHKVKTNVGYTSIETRSIEGINTDKQNSYFIKTFMIFFPLSIVENIMYSLLTSGKLEEDTVASAIT